LIPQWLRGSVILTGQVSKHTNLSPINTAFQCLLLCVHFSLTSFICFLSCLSFCGDLLQYSGLGDWIRCQRLVSSEHPEQMPYTNKLKRQPRRPQKKNTLTLSLTSPAILTLKSPKASECAAGTAGRPHPKANLDRWCAKQHSTSGHVSTFCCSFPNPTLNGSSLSLLAEIQVLLHMDVTQKCNGYSPLVLSFQRWLSTANLNLRGKYKGATSACSNMLIIKFSWKTNAHSRELWCVHLQHAVSF